MGGSDNEKLRVEGKTLSLELDTGAEITIGGEDLLNGTVSKLQPTNIMLKMHKRLVEKPVGVIMVSVEGNDGDSKQLPLVIILGKGPLFLGRIG